VYAGEGMNAPDSVAADFFPRAEHLALFAVTVGEERRLAGDGAAIREPREGDQKPQPPDASRGEPQT
jgi:hypothetical protein